jgi:O-antigen/teichoic acid export membrane protein
MEYFVGISALFYVWVNVFLYYPHDCCDQFTLAHWIIGKEHEEYYTGLDIVPVLFMANILFGMYYNLSVWYKLSDKTIYGAMISFGGALVTIAGNIITIPVYGFRGSAWTTLVCFTLMVTMSYLLSRKHFPIPYKLSRIFFFILLAIGFVWLQDILLEKAFITRAWMVMSIKLFFTSAFTMIIISSLKLNKRLNLNFLKKKI